MLSLVPWLLAHDGITIVEAAAHFGVTPEQLEKDLWLLIVCGLPGYGPDQLVDIDFWEDGRIHVLDAQTLDRPLRLGADEAMSLLLGLRMLEQVPGVHDRSAIVSALAKLTEAVDLPGAEASVSAEPRVRQEIAAAIATSINLGADLSITYASGTSDLVTERRVSPRQVVLADGRAYLEAYCHLAEAQRTFRLDRIMSVTAALGSRQETEIATPAVAPESALLSVSTGSSWLVDVLGAEVVGAEPDGRKKVRLEYADPRWLVRLVLSRGGQVEVLEPGSVRSDVADAAAAALKAYAGA
jgi:predicted DNA-binding transcriptional regulator YafY